MAEDETFDVNVKWTLDSIDKIKKEGEYRIDVCFDCEKENVKVKTYLIAVANHKLNWTSGSDPVYEKVRVQYCDDCVNALVKSLSEEVTSE